MKTNSMTLAAAVLILANTGVRASGGPNDWPGLAEDAPCLIEQWEPLRTLVWAAPGVGGMALEPKNWTEFASAAEYAAGKGGEPATAGPDASTDLILPDAPAGQCYIVGFMVAAKQRTRNGPSGSAALSCRHLSIGAGAALDGGMGIARGKPVYSDMPGDDSTIDIGGNVTVNGGGSIYGHLQIVGDKHTWFSMGESPEPLGRSLSIRKGQGAGVTMMVPQYDLIDAVSVESGRLVLAPGTVLRINATPQARIAATDPAAAKTSLANATFGEQCAVTGDAIYSTIQTDDFKGGPGRVEFVDGLGTDCEILFPLGDRLIVRSIGHRTAQSFDLKSVHAVIIDGKRTEFQPVRPLTTGEQRLREVNALWADVPGEGQIGDYGKYDWPEAPLMVWRRPGVSGSRFVGANWLDEAGQPFFHPPVSNSDEGADPPGADILLPAADVFYQSVGDRPSWRCRHLTIERNAHFFLTYDIGGNLWMKDGSGMQAPWFGKYSNTEPGVHRFLHFDGMRLGRSKGKSDAPQPVDSAELSISQWGRYQTGPGGTLEIIGTHLVNDHFFVGGEGRMIMSEGSHLAPLGARAAFWIQPGATVVLLQDARIGVESVATDHACIPVLVSGTLQIGTPRRPITRDLLFPLAGMEEDEINREPGENMRGSGVSLLVGKEGRFIMHSVDPTKARLVFKMHDSERAKARGERWGDPKGIVLDFAGQAELNGVVFDNILEGGIMATPAQRAGWKNIFYGEHNLAAPEKLYWKPQAGE